MKNKKENNKPEVFYVILKKNLSVLKEGDKIELTSRYLNIPMGDGMVTLDIYQSPEVFEILN